MAFRFGESCRGGKKGERKEEKQEDGFHEKERKKGFFIWLVNA